MMPMMPNSGGSWGGGFWFGPILMILFWLIIIGGAILIIYALVNPQRSVPPSTGESALEILKSRYAKGEISKEEFEEKKKDLA